MGYKHPYFSQIVTGKNIGDRFIDRMTKSFGFQFPDKENVHQSAKSHSPAITPEQTAIIEALAKLSKALDAHASAMLVIQREVAELKGSRATTQ